MLRSSRQLITMMEALAGDWEAGSAKLKRLFRRRWYRGYRGIAEVRQR